MSNQTVHPSFTLTKTHHIESLNIDVEEYTHNATGAQHIHLSADNNENVFLVALRTVPQDSRGVAHILEHTALCGSEKYPVRDPFFMMIRRSLNTFMNAFTSSDWTAYPFASQNRKDFDNLLDVYLDAVFFSRLDELDFLQEGHRLEFKEADNPASELTYKGVVFNEMKGAMSSTSSILWHTLCKYLYPTTTYHYNSGGDPEAIPDLGYQQLVDFYKTHYHPSNAIFMTFGDIPAAVHQQKFQEQALAKFKPLDKEITVTNEKRYLSPVNIEEYYAYDEADAAEQKTHLVMGWLLGEATDLEASMQAQLLNAVLLDNSASPLQQALETTDLGTSPSPLCGLDSSQKEMCFVCGIEGSDPEKSQAFEELVISVLKNVAENGVPQEQVEACLHQLELQQREITGDGYPYGLSLILSALTNATHRGDPTALLDLDPVIEKLRRQIQDPAFIKGLASELLLNNPHRIRLTMKPDPHLSAKRVAQEQAQLETIKASLTEAEQQAIVAQASALKERQEQVDDASLLPKVTLDDIPRELAYTAADQVTSSVLPLTQYSAGTNGLVYQQMILPLPALSDELLDVLPVYTMCLTELGLGDKSYLDTQLWQSQVCGSIHASASVRSREDDLQNMAGHLILSAKGLGGNQPAMSELMEQTLTTLRFDEHARIKELIAQARAQREMSVTSNGHVLAMTAAARGISPGAALAHSWGGLSGIQSIKALDQAISSDEGLNQLVQKLQQIHQLISNTSSQFLLVGEAEKNNDYRQAMEQVFSSLPQLANQANSSSSFSPFNYSSEPQRIQQLWQTSTQVNFCAKAYPSVSMTHPDAAALNVLGGFLRNGFLHRSIREQGGAYGGGASQDNHTGAFRFYSYRDPRIEGTLDDFDQSINWLKETKHAPDQVEEAILGVVSSIDKPASPAGEAKRTFHAELYGQSRDIRARFRDQVVQVTTDDLVRVADSYLTADKANTAVITNQENASVAEPLGLAICTL